MSDLRTNHAGVVSPLTPQRCQHYEVTATHEYGFKSARRKQAVKYYDAVYIVRLQISYANAYYGFRSN